MNTQTVIEGRIKECMTALEAKIVQGLFRNLCGQSVLSSCTACCLVPKHCSSSFESVLSSLYLSCISLRHSQSRHCCLCTKPCCGLSPTVLCKLVSVFSLVVFLRL